jgi:hypothetical protein
MEAGDRLAFIRLATFRIILMSKDGGKHLNAIICIARFFAFLTLWTTCLAQPTILEVTPSSAPETGGVRVQLSGTNFPYFASEAVVVIGSSLSCSNIEIIVPFKSLSCQVPACPHCVAMPLQLKVNTPHSSPIVSQPVAFRYTPYCYEGDPPLLPKRFSAAENCSVCTEMVALAVSAMPDVTSYNGLSESLRQSCSAVAIRNFGRVSETYCRIDVSAACKIMFYSMGSTIADAIWDHWDEYAVFGGLPDVVCREIGKCT